MRFGGILLAATLLLVACSSDPEPKEPTRTPTPTSTVTLPAMPDQAKEDSPAGAAAFVDHWVDVFNYASQTGDVDELQRLSSPECEGCQKYIDIYGSTYERGGYFRGGEWTLSDLDLAVEGESTFVTTSYRADASTYREGPDTEEFTDPAESETISFEVARQGSWVVLQLGLGDVR